MNELKQKKIEEMDRMLKEIVSEENLELYIEALDVLLIASREHLQEQKEAINRVEEHKNRAIEKLERTKNENV